MVCHAKSVVVHSNRRLQVFDLIPEELLKKQRVEFD
jgi:hypothetical protein